MTAKDLTRALVVVGGINWGLVALAKFDLVAFLTGRRFGSTNAATRVIYAAVGAAALVEAAELGQALTDS